VLHPDSGADAVLSHVNPWNFTARMMIVHPYQLIKLLTTPYDVVHIVMPANLSGMWILALYKILRCVKVREDDDGSCMRGGGTGGGMEMDVVIFRMIPLRPPHSVHPFVLFSYISNSSSFSS
jgi:hypothetical protein